MTDAVTGAPHQIVADLQRRLHEALAQQDVTAGVLKVISRSTFDLQAVLDTLVTSAAQLCAADGGIIWLRKDDLFHAAAASGSSQQGMAFFRDHPRSIHDKSLAPRVLRCRRTVHIPDRSLDPEFAFPGVSNLASTMLGVPLLRDDRIEGVFTLSRREVAPFTPSQIELVESFADQSMIAIENSRLFNEVQARTEDLRESLQQQTATSDVLKVISRSAFDLDTVMNTLARSASELCAADLSALFLRAGDVLTIGGSSDVDPKTGAFLQQVKLPIGDQSYLGRAILHGVIANVPDFENDPNIRVQTFQQVLGFKAMLIVPLMREGRGVGVFALCRNTVGSFSQRQIELVQTFADQAVIAIENVRLFDEVQARTKELAASLEDLRAAQDRLVQTEKLASLGQLTAGIAHEIKNPLNFVNNFSLLSAELIDELHETLAPAPLDHKMRDDVGELTQMLKSNLKKVVQHGKRADSIVKNMLQHSREGSGERRSQDLNALVSESLNLAYHGARAERSNFKITLEQDLDPDAGSLDLYPQEMTRALLNLISNGFYAATKRKAELSDGDFEPALIAVTRNLGNAVEIRIRDNGTGIAAEVREKMFNPFFTTKPTGEGTGLGLSMTHDIIVKQHGGRIDVETEPGSFTEFIITLARAS